MSTLTDTLFPYTTLFRSRTYVTEDGVDDGDRHYLTWAVTQARRDSTADDLSIFDFVVALISTELKREPGRPYRRADVDRKRTRLNSSHYCASRMQTSA